MSGAETRSIRQLFKDWRAGDAAAGQGMAQRVADWYYAVATSRLGEQRGRKPCDAACAAFGSGIVQVSDSRQLEGWAHGLITTEIEKGGSRARDGDDPSLYTREQKPKGLLVRAREALPAEVALLEAVYGAHADRGQIEELAGPLGGNPIGILEARYRVKRWLRDNARVRFDVVPDKPILDRAPMPLYEADRMASTAEEAQFELWMLTDLVLCKDIAEFAHFAIALRGGLPSERAAAPERASASVQTKPAAPPPPAAPAAAPPAKSGGTGMMLVIGGVVVAVIALGVAAAAAVVLWGLLG
jgi:hypothetical protein